MAINALFGSSLPEIYIYIYIYKQRFFLPWLYTWLQDKNYQIWGLSPRLSILMRSNSICQREREREEEREREREREREK